MNVTVETRSYMSAQHLWAAQHYVRLAQDFERERAGAEGIFIRHRSYVFTAVSEAVAFLEAFINEVFRDAAQLQSTGGKSSTA